MAEHLDQGGRSAILLNEHDMKMVMRLSDHVFVMDYGRKIARAPLTRCATIRR
jgi:branched-chain amino acid transport system ATP-binding protein